MKSIGRIFGEVVDNSFSFCSKEMFEGQYIKIKSDEKDNESSELIGEIIKRGIVNRFVTTPQIINYLDENIDYKKDTIYTYDVSPIGTIYKNRIINEAVDAIPGKNVYPADEKELSVVYGITDDGVYVGRLKKQPNCCVRIRPEKAFNPHMFVVGRTGSGKSYFVKKLMKDLGYDFWIFSPSDEYDDAFEESVNVVKDVILELNIDSLSYYFGLNASEESILRKINFNKDRIYTSKDICEEIYGYFENQSSKKEEQIHFEMMKKDNQNNINIPAYGNSLMMKMKNLRNLQFSSNRDKVTVSLESVVYNLGKYTQLEQECIINFLAFQLFIRKRSVKKENIKKHIVVIEEAHNFISSQKGSLCKEILVRISREGRKHGISLCFITQRPRFFDQTALSQSGNRIIFSLPNPDDVRHIMEEAVYYRPDLALNIQKQKVGECIIIGDIYNDIVEVRVDE